MTLKQIKQNNSWHCGNIRLFDGEEYTGQLGGIVIEDGIICKIGEKWKSINSQKKGYIPYIDGNGSNLCAGLIDSKVQLPNINKLSLEKLAKDAHLGGVTSVLVHGGHLQTLGSLQQVQHCLSIAKDINLGIKVVASASYNACGEKMSELGLMKELGINIFSDGIKPLKSAKDVSIWFQYAKPISVSLWEPVEEETIVQDGLINEGEISLKLGLKPRPPIAEKLLIDRDSTLATEYGGKLILGPISTSLGLQSLKTAIQYNSNIIGVTAWNYLLFNDSLLNNYDSNFKLFPPLRKQEDVELLRKECVKKDSAIKIIVSDHIRNHRDDIKQPFVESAIGRKSVHNFLNYLLNVAKICDIPWYNLLPLVTINPAKLAGLSCGRLTVGSPADLLIFDIINNKEEGNKLPNSLNVGINAKIRNLSIAGKFVTI